MTGLDGNDLGAMLRRLRLDARLSQRDLALRIGFHETAVTSIERGERAPSTQYLSGFIAVLQVADAAAAAIWQAYRQTPTTGATEPSFVAERVPCPYRGLSAFREQDAALFFGRATAVRRVIGKLSKRSLVAVVGASGSGKSSAVFAGVVPQLGRDGQWDVVALRPGSDPLGAMASALAPSATDISTAVARRLRRAKKPLLIVVDQFEELFTHATEDACVSTFLDRLAEVASGAQPQPLPVKVLITFRGDFYGRAIAHRAFSDLLQDSVINLPPMSRAELRQAITEPARTVGLVLESGLADRILDDAGTEPGNLPLLEFALTRLWEEQDGVTLTHEAYERIGRLAGAITAQAETAYASLSPEQQYAARQLLVRLVQVARPEEDGNDARRRVPLAEVAALPGVGHVVDALVAARLVVTDAEPNVGPTAELAHEAIIRSWDRLRGWLVEDRQFLLWQQRVRRWTDEWRTAGDPDDALLRGGLVDEAARWLALKGRDLIAIDLLPYLDASLADAEEERRRRVSGIVDQLLTVRPRDVLAVLTSIDRTDASVRDILAHRLAVARPAERWRLHAALLAGDGEQVEPLIDALDRLSPEELVAVRDSAGLLGELFVTPLWELIGRRRAWSEPVLPAAVMLAAFAPADERWARAAPQIASQLVTQNQLHLRVLVDALRPAREHLLEPLYAIFADTAERRAAVKDTTATILLDLAPDRPELLARMAAAATDSTYDAIFAALESALDPHAVQRLKMIAHDPPAKEATEEERVTTGRRRASALSTLVRLRTSIRIDDILAAAPDPELGTQFSLRAREKQVPVGDLLDLLVAAESAAARYSLVLALGGYRARSVEPSTRERAISLVTHIHQTDPDAGMHAAATWLLRRWKRIEQLKTTAPYDPTGRRTWFTVDTRLGAGLTFSVFRPGRFLMGSPASEAERSDYESPRQDTTLTRSFAMCTREVTRAEFEAFMGATGTLGLPDIGEWSPLGVEPVVAPTWFEAGLFADWLGTTLQGKDAFYFGMADQLDSERVRRAIDTVAPPPQDVGALRLPTEAEWEYACRAGTTTSYSFGSDRSVLDRFGWYADNSGLKTHEAGLLRPNPAGLFSVHGQCWEWCLDWYGPYSAQPLIDPGGPQSGDRKVLRGGCWNLGARYARSACRNAHIPSNRNYYITFRLAMTLPEIDPTWHDGDPNPLPWTGQTISSMGHT